MLIVVNGAQHEVAQDATVLQLVREVSGRDFDEQALPLDGKPTGLAVARWGLIVPRAQWASTTLAAGDVVDIVTAVQGG